MLTRERRSLVPPPPIPDFVRTSRKSTAHSGLPPQATLPPLTSALSRRAALFGAVTVAGCTAAALPANIETVVPSANDRRLAIAADQLTARQARADRHAAGAGPDPADLYNRAVAEVDLVATGMAALPAGTMSGVLTKLRAMQVPIVRDDDEAHGLALSVCRDLRRLQTMGALS